METEVSAKIGAAPTSGAPNASLFATAIAPAVGTPASARSSFPREHRQRLHSTNPLGRLHKEIKRRTRVVESSRAETR
jgi:Transposase, Mutator family